MAINSLVRIIYPFVSVQASVLHDTGLFIKISTTLFNILILQINFLMLLQELISNLYLHGDVSDHLQLNFASRIDLVLE